MLLLGRPISVFLQEIFPADLRAEPHLPGDQINDSAEGREAELGKDSGLRREGPHERDSLKARQPLVQTLPLSTSQADLGHQQD